MAIGKKKVRVKGRREQTDSLINTFYQKCRKHYGISSRSESQDKLFESIQNLKFANDFLYRKRKRIIKIYDDKTNLSINGITILVYLNSLSHRLWDLMYASLSLHREGNYLSSLMIQRMTYETIAHSRFFLDKINEAILNNDEQKYTELIAIFVYSQEIIDETFQDDVRDLNKFQKRKLPHINDSLRYYKKVKKHTRKKESYSNKRIDNIYQLLSQMSHPNAYGLVYFYSSNDPETWNHNFSNKQEKTLDRFYEYSEEMFRELVNHCDFIKNFLSEYDQINDQFFKYLSKKTNNKVRKYLIRLSKEHKKKLNLKNEITIH